MNKSFQITASALAALSLSAACGGEAFSEDELTTDDIATIENALCSNPGGVNGVTAALAVAAANEMHRWLPGRDFQWNSATGMLELSKYAKPRCPNRICANTQALLDMQKPEAHLKVTFPGNIKLDSTQLRATLKADWDKQMACNLAGTCPVDYHDLVYHHKASGPCGDRFYYDAFEMGTTTPLDAAQANLFSNQLLFLGHPINPFLAFSVENEQASVDPTYGLTESSATSVGSCTAACAKYSATSIKGKCCVCNGSTKRFVVSAFNTSMYLCQ